MKTELWQLGKEWMTKFVAEVRWNDPDFQYFRDLQMEEFKDKKLVVEDEAKYIMEYVPTLEIVDNKVVFNRFSRCGKCSYLTDKQSEELLEYVNTHRKKQ